MYKIIITQYTGSYFRVAKFNDTDFDRKYFLRFLSDDREGFSIDQLINVKDHPFSIRLTRDILKNVKV